MQRVFYSALLCFGMLLAENLQEKVNKGNQLLQEKKLEEALAVYNEALIDAPESAIIKFNIGNVYYQQGRYDKAQERYEEALNITQDSVLQARIHYNIGNVYYRQGKWKESLESYQSCIELCKEIDKDSAPEEPLPEEKARKNHALVQKKILEHVAKKKQEDEKNKPDENHPVEKLKKLVQEQTQHNQQFAQDYRQFEAQLKQTQFLSLLQGELKNLQSLNDPLVPENKARWTLLKERFLKGLWEELIITIL
ncbi:MAG: tetratricopeptide repeat protein, partial [Planctomycetota bacterium]